MSERQMTDSGLLGAIAEGHVAPEAACVGATVALLAAGDEAAAWRRALEQAGAAVRHAADPRSLLRSGEVDLVVVATPRLVHGELAEPGAPPFLAVRDALLADELTALLRAGARDVLARPVAAGALVAACARVLSRQAPRALRAAPAADSGLPVSGAIGAAIARTRLPVMLLGETGSGKSRLARMLHETLTPHAPFVEINAGTLPGNLLVSELFGHERGAFTGAVGAKPGLVAAANGGTLFLDEIGELPPDAQAQLLSFLDTGSYRALGAVRSAQSDARVFTATNRNLETAVAQGRFREDLYYRLASIVVPLVPLRDQRARLPGLVSELMHQVAGRARAEPPALGPDAVRVLTEHRWPGNVRQLRFVIERLVAAWPGQRIGAAEVCAVIGGPVELAAPDVADGRGAADPKDAPAPIAREVCSLAEMERELVELAMQKARGNRTRAAELLGITPRGLYNKLRRIGTSFRQAE